jgi:hypothetical protein
METGDAFYLMQQAAPLLAIGADMRGFHLAQVLPTLINSHSVLSGPSFSVT